MLKNLAAVLALAMLVLSSNEASAKTIRMAAPKTDTGLRTATLKVNGVPFIGYLDTGASGLSISGKLGCELMKKGLFKKADVIGFSSSLTANGRVPVVLLSATIEIAGKRVPVVSSLNLGKKSLPNCKDDGPNLVGMEVFRRFSSIEFPRDGNFVLLKE